MNFIQPQPRGQMSFGSLENAIEPDNPVRLIDAFVDQTKLKRLGFGIHSIKDSELSISQKLFSILI